MSIIKCKFCKPVTDNFNILKPYLPEDYKYLVCNLSVNSTNFKTRLRMGGKNQDHAHKWLEEFQMQTKCTMRVERTYPHSGTKNVFKIDLRCQHNTRPRNEKVREKESCKNTDCPAKMGITIKRVVTERKSRSKDPHLPDHPTVIQINFCHNHDILTPEILKHRSVLPEVKEKLLNLFKLGHNPSTALDMHKYDLLLEHGENFEKIAHDRALLPDSQFCYRLYYKIVRKHSLPLNTENTECDIPASSPHKKSTTPLSNCENSSILNSTPQKELLSSEISSLNSISSEKKMNKKKRKLENTAFDPNEMTKQISSELYKFCKAGGIAGMLKVDDTHSVMALCTPLMLRVHSFLRHSGELVFVDSYGEPLEGSGEPSCCRVYLFLTYSSIGAVPLGCVVTTSGEGSCLRSAIELWKQILPQRERFFNKGEDGPDIFFTNDSEPERQTLRLCFPRSQLLVCLSHLLQASWTFLVDRKNTIKKEHRSVFFSKVKLLLFSQTVDELEMNYSYAASDPLVKSNALFLEYLNQLYKRRHDWSLVYCRHLLMPHRAPDDLSVFWEAATIVLKDPVLSRARTYNPLQVLDFLSRLDTYYERRLIDLANGRFDSVRLSRFLLVDLPRESYTITQFSEIEYEVHNDTKDTTHQVDVSLGVCECRTGRGGAPCKHQLLVFRNFSVPVYDCVPPSTIAEKNDLFLLATGYPVDNESTVESVSVSKVTAASTASSAVTAEQDVVSTAPAQQQKSSLCMTTGQIIIHDLDPCSESAFFLDENLNQSCLGQSIDSSIVNNLPSSVADSLVQQQQQVSSIAASAGGVLEQQHHPTNTDLGSEAQEAMFDSSSRSLLSQLDPSQPRHPVSLGGELGSALDHSQQQLSADNVVASVDPSVELPRNESASSTDSIIDHICTVFRERTAKSPATFKPALCTFLKNLEKLSSDSSLEHALYSFGKFSKTAKPLFKRKIADNKLIGLQSNGELKKRKQQRGGSAKPCTNKDKGKNF